MYRQPEVARARGDEGGAAVGLAGCAGSEEGGFELLVRGPERLDEPSRSESAGVASSSGSESEFMDGVYADAPLDANAAPHDARVQGDVASPTADPWVGGRKHAQAQFKGPGLRATLTPTSRGGAHRCSTRARWPLWRTATGGLYRSPFARKSMAMIPYVLCRW